MEITIEILKRVSDGETAGEVAAYQSGSENTIENHLKATINDLEQSNKIQVDLDSSYESGFASYAEVFCFKKDGSSTQTEHNRTSIDGITVLLCALAPIAVLGATHLTHDKNSGITSSNQLRPEGLNVWPSGDWIDVINEIHRVLEKNQFTIYGSEEMKQVLPFETWIATIFAEPPYQVFDAFFQFYD
jgi:hypothetical protein